MKLPSVSDIYDAANRLSGITQTTPLLFAYHLSQHLEARVFLKAENLQHTGSFKFRGAYNALAQIAVEDRSKGVIACSSGNHAQGVALAGQILGIPVRIVMPHDAPTVKVVRTRNSGADVIFYDRNLEDRDMVAKNLVVKTGAHFIHPFDNANVIAGQGTTGLEVVNDLKKQKERLDILLVCTGGGGLTAGMALVCHEAYPDAKIFAVEPEEFDDYKRSLITGRLLANNALSGSICDALLTPKAGEIGFAINQKRLAGGLTVNDDEALCAVHYAYEHHRLIVEPGGAVALAALMFGKLNQTEGNLKGKTIVVTLSGGNIDEQLLQQALMTRRPF